MKPTLLVLISLQDTSRERIEAAFDVIYVPEPAERAAALNAHGATIRAMLTNGTVGVSAEDIDRMPQLEFISALGAGYENIAVDHARSRNQATRTGTWRDGLSMRPNVSGKRLGNIGEKVARRGFRHGSGLPQP